MYAQCTLHSILFNSIPIPILKRLQTSGSQYYLFCILKPVMGMLVCAFFIWSWFIIWSWSDKYCLEAIIGIHNSDDDDLTTSLIIGMGLKSFITIRITTSELFRRCGSSSAIEEEGIVNYLVYKFVFTTINLCQFSIIIPPIHKIPMRFTWKWCKNCSILLTAIMLLWVA